MADQSNSKTDRSSPLGAMIKIAIVPALIVIGLLIASPNYQKPDLSATQSLGYPLGGDFLQEYVGGQLIQNPSANGGDLYDAQTFESAQHDRTRLGFAWEESQFFPAVYPPFWYAAVSPLSGLPYLIASRVWLFLMAIALIAALWLLARNANVPVPLIVVMCLSPPIIQSLNAGQKGTLLLLILSGSYVLLRKRQYFWSGLVFAMIAFKPHLGVAIGLWMLVNKNWRWVAGTFSGLAVLAVASFLISPDLVKDYMNVVLGFGDYVQSGGYNLNESFSLWSFWQQLVAHPTAAKMLTIVTSLAVLVTSLIWFRNEKREDSAEEMSSIKLDQAFSAMVIVTVLTSPHLYTYDLAMLLLPIGLLGRVALNSQTDKRDYLVWLPTVLLVLLMFASEAITNFALSSRFQAGVFLLIAAWASIKQLCFSVRSPAS